MLRILFEDRAVLLEKDSELYGIVADLHIGFEIDLKGRGIRLPLQTDKISSQLLNLVDKYGIRKLILLGDLKHSILGYERREAEDVRRLLEQLCQLVEEVYLIPGNHDGNIEEILYKLKVKVYSSRGLRLRDGELSVGLFHGHAWPSLRVLSSEVLVIGHIHPTVEFRDRMGLRYVEPAWIRVRIDRNRLAYSMCKHLKIDPGEDPILSLKVSQGIELRTRWVLVMPAFNPFLSGLVINNTAKMSKMSPILSAIGRDLEKSEIYLHDGTYLGSPKLLSKLSEV